MYSPKTISIVHSWCSVPVSVGWLVGWFHNKFQNKQIDYGPDVGCSLFGLYNVLDNRYTKENNICYRSPSMNHSAHNMDFKMGRSVTKTRKPFPKAQKHTVSQRWRVNHIIDKISCIFLKNSQNRLQTFVTIKKLFPKIEEKKTDSFLKHFIWE